MIQTQRTCVACRKRTDPMKLIRVTIRSGEWIVQPRPSGNGRTAYVCLTASCIDQGLKKQRFQRSLNTTAKVVSTETLLRGAETAENRYLSQLFDGARRGRLLSESENRILSDLPTNLNQRIVRSKERLGAIRHEITAGSAHRKEHRIS